MNRVVLFHGPGRPLEVVRLPDPEPRGAEVLVRVDCCTLCTSDLHTHAGRRPGPTPSVLGHEAVGRIVAFGPDAAATSLAVGDRVTWTVAAGCGRCFFCADGLFQKCERLYKYGHEPAPPDRPFNGGLAEVTLLAAGTGIFRVPDDVPDAVAAPANCATATAAAVLRIGAGGAIAGRTVLILGAGTLGLTAAAMSRVADAAAVVVCDPDQARGERAISFGATHAVSTDADELTAVVAGATRGRGADVVLELAGVRSAVVTALAQARVGGTVVLAGTVLPTEPVALDPEMVVRRMLTIRGVHNYGPEDLRAAVAFLAGPGRAYPFASLVGRTFRLDDAEQAFAHAHAHPGTRVALTP